MAKAKKKVKRKSRPIVIGHLEKISSKSSMLIKS